MFITSFIFIAVALSLMSASSAGRRMRETMLLKVPALGRLFHCSVMSRMSEAMALLVGAGCDMGQCLRLASGASGSEKLKLECGVLAGQVDQGDSLLEAGLAGKMIPRLFLYSIQLGAQRNELQDNLHGLSEMYAEQTRCHQARLQTLLLPLLLIFLGGTIGITVVAMFLPIISIVTVLM
jgi:type IV pilus assembly protein PilC